MKMKVVLFIFLSVGSCLLCQGVSGVGSERVSVSVMEGDSVTLQTGVERNQQDKITWYFNDTRIAHINGDQRKTCTDVQCNEGTERFRDRLKLDHQTGSLTITNTRTTDSGDYHLLITSGGSDSRKIFRVSVHGVSAAERDKMQRKSVKEGESVTLHTGVMKNPTDSMKWYFTDTLIAEITGDQSQICTDDQCKERFRDRLTMDNQTGSLTITNTRTEDSGDYQLQINSRFSRRHRRSISIINIKSFEVSVTGSGLSSAVVAGIVVVLLVSVAVAAGVIYSRHRRSKNDELRERNNDPVFSPINEMD